MMPHQQQQQHMMPPPMMYGQQQAYHAPSASMPPPAGMVHEPMAVDVSYNVQGQSQPATEVRTPRHISANEAKLIDKELVEEYGYDIETLIEMAGFSVAQGVASIYNRGRVLIICGTGNNGRDGLVAARYLKYFGYAPTVWVPKATTNEKVLQQLQNLRNLDCQVYVGSSMPDVMDPGDLKLNYTVCIDCIFGFSFRAGPISEPFKSCLQLIADSQVAVCSVDVPSGWDVDSGRSETFSIDYKLDAVISLTAPKLCVQDLKVRHVLAGRFIPEKLALKYDLRLPEFPGSMCSIRLHSI